MLELMAHFCGDYVLQSDWMALNKRTNFFVCLIHAFTYTVPFWFLATGPQALFIMTSHLLIDFTAAARYVCFAKNYLAPPWAWPIWAECKANGYPADRPLWLTTWLYIITDNFMHVACNYFALRYL